MKRDQLVIEHSAADRSQDRTVTNGFFQVDQLDSKLIRCWLISLSWVDAAPITEPCPPPE